MFQVFDGHCDVLYRMWREKNPDLFWSQDNDLHSSFVKLKQGNVRVQTMGIFVPPDVPNELKTYTALEMLDMFHTHILSKYEHVQVLQDLSMLTELNQEKKQGQNSKDQLYVILSLEGAEALQGNLMYVRTLYRLGVRSIGLTWNGRNEAADGVGVPHPGGLSSVGLDFVQEMNRLSMAIDISHLAEEGFWNCIQASTQPIMASHCNARAICDHPRNLYDEQLKAIFANDGVVGVNFVPAFLQENTGAKVDDVLKHVDHMLSLDGEDHVGFGSDFDGMLKTVARLEHAGKWTELIHALQRHYSETIVHKLLFDNWLKYYQRLWESC